MARLLCLKAAWAMDTQGVRAAAPLISQIKVIAPRVALEVIDQAVQMHGGAGVSQDFPLARMWTQVRTLRLADGPDAVHRRVIAKAEMKRYTNEGGATMSGGFPEDTSALDAWASAHVEGLRGPERGEEIPDRPVEPDLSDRDAERPLRAAPQAARQALEDARTWSSASFACCRRSSGAGFPAPRALALCEDESVDRHGVLSDGACRRPHLLGPGAARACARGARADLRRDERGARAAARDRRRGRRASPTSASPAAISPASGSAGPSNTARARPARIADMERLIAWLGDNVPRRRRPRRRWCTATGASTT